MNYVVSNSQKGLKLIPFHKHNEYEITYYKNTYGVLRTPEGKYDFFPGSIVIIPPETVHESSSLTDLDGIYIKGSLNHIFQLDSPVVIKDNEDCEAQKLISLILKNRYGNKEYLTSLCDSYVHYLALNMKLECESVRAVNDIITQITNSALIPDVNVGRILNNCGYSEDYIRSMFKKITRKTPIEFLTDIRVSHACFLIESVGATLSLAQIAEKCGYSDYVYFSKKFKEVMGVSPKKYKSNNQ